MTIENSQLWQRVSLDLQQEVGQARWMSTFARTTLVEGTDRPAEGTDRPATPDAGKSGTGSKTETDKDTGTGTGGKKTAAGKTTTPKTATAKTTKAKAGAKKKPGAKKPSTKKADANTAKDAAARAAKQPAKQPTKPPANQATNQPGPEHIHFQLVTPNKVTRDNIVSNHLPDIRRLIAKHCQVDNDKVSLDIQIGRTRTGRTRANQPRANQKQGDQLPPPTDFAATLPFELDRGEPDSREPGGEPSSEHPSGDHPNSDHHPGGHGLGEGLEASQANHPSQAANTSQTAPPNQSTTHPNQSTTPPNQTDPNRFNPRFTFDNFVSGSTNRFAYQATLAVAEHPGQSYNPLFIYGNVGLGKTHLLQATANFMSRYYSQMRVRYVSTETFLNDFLAAIRKKQGDKFREKYRQLDALILDDIQFLEGKESTQEEIFHTFNYLYENKKQLVISSDRPPDSLQTLENRLRSRFKSGLITDIQPPEVETRLVILQLNVDHHNKLRESLNRPPTRVPDDVLGFIAENFKENVRELEGALTRVLAHAEIMGVSPTCETAAELLGDLMSHSPVQLPSAKEIIRLATEVFEVSEEKLTGKSRIQGLVTARHITMYAIREHTDLSYPAIGEFFSGRDHSSVMHAVAKIKRSMKENETTYRDVLNLTSKINAARRSAKLKTAA